MSILDILPPIKKKDLKRLALNLSGNDRTRPCDPIIMSRLITKELELLSYLIDLELWLVTTLIRTIMLIHLKFDYDLLQSLTICKGLQQP